MSNGRLAYYDLQAESSGWLFKSQLAGVGSILRRPQYRPHSLLALLQTVGAYADGRKYLDYRYRLKIWRVWQTI